MIKNCISCSSRASYTLALKFSKSTKWGKSSSISIIYCLSSAKMQCSLLFAHDYHSTLVHHKWCLLEPLKGLFPFCTIQPCLHGMRIYSPTHLPIVSLESTVRLIHFWTALFKHYLFKRDVNHMFTIYSSPCASVPCVLILNLSLSYHNINITAINYIYHSFIYTVDTFILPILICICAIYQTPSKTGLLVLNKGKSISLH